jgi:hypothetical protein
MLSHGSEGLSNRAELLQFPHPHLYNGITTITMTQSCNEVSSAIVQSIYLKAWYLVGTRYTFTTSNETITIITVTLKDFL